MSHSSRTLYYREQDALVLPAKLSSLDTLNAWISDIAVELALPKKVTRHLYIAVDEIAANIISYANIDGADKSCPVITLRISFDSAKRMLTLVFSDNGIPFNPLELEEPDIFAPEHEREIGGLGVLLVKKLMDSVEYYHSDGQNILTLRKIVN